MWVDVQEDWTIITYLYSANNTLFRVRDLYRCVIEFSSNVISKASNKLYVVTQANTGALARAHTHATHADIQLYLSQLSQNFWSFWINNSESLT